MKKTKVNKIRINLDTDNYFEKILQKNVTRRSALKGSFSALATICFGSNLLLLTSSGSSTNKKLNLNFDTVKKNIKDDITLANGYNYQVLLRTGDPIKTKTNEYKNDGTDRVESFVNRAGDHHDGMHFFGLNSNNQWDPNVSDRGLLCINHESITAEFLHVSGQSILGGKRTSEKEVLKEMLMHGVSIIEIKKNNSGFFVEKNSLFNKRITTLTKIQMSGPAAKSKNLITLFSPDGTHTRGTLGNCANGHTPWGTYLTCEENWAKYFYRPESEDALRNNREMKAFKRYNLITSGKNLWATVKDTTLEKIYSRWNALKIGISKDGSDDFRNCPNTFGWVVEIDPFNPQAPIKKRTALGRFAHEGAWPGKVTPGEPLVWYMGCDATHEYIYKFVSSHSWNPDDNKGGISSGDKYLDDGKLYVARFNDNGTGEWLELEFGKNDISKNSKPYEFINQSDVLIHARLAADFVGATKMDRPEWGAVNPINGDVYMSLTCNPSRKIEEVDSSNPRFYNSPKKGNDQKGNTNGHIIRWAENKGKGFSTKFEWDIFLFGSREDADKKNVNISDLSSANDFSRPDGLWFSNNGLLWIQTDDHAYTDVSNCMLLAAIPGKVGDGNSISIINQNNKNKNKIKTFIGERIGEEKLKRFLVGPKGCEITGLAETPDGKTLFVNIQHPGENTNGSNFTILNSETFDSNWPDGKGSRPRSATIVISRNNEGTVGSDFI